MLVYVCSIYWSDTSLLIPMLTLLLVISRGSRTFSFMVFEEDN